ncbi:unnamed protein product [Parascedosporium putredinis]|uniref:VLRF1 domain-containing protein n=1 Tax=Parascedosporium putredinis TaxID=1442378 RepID=A0A9P1M782_9PEZI|nr:unnamed protein product [Parascedosporium putredinis]CAI7988092.1 unnamed protein product [Parascedosporium putredinis]
MATATDPRTEELLRRPIYVYDMPPEVLVSITFKDAPGEALAQTEQSDSPDDRSASPAPSNDSVVGSQACSLCALSFATVDDQRSHLKSDFHNYNLKQKLRGGKPVTEDEFERLIADLDESLSGSDSSESEEDEDEDEGDDRRRTIPTKSKGPRGKAGAPSPPVVQLPLLPENSYFGLYRALFTDEELKDESSIVEVIKRRQLQPLAIPKPAKDGSLPQIAYKGPHIFLCMIGGGHFAAMVVSLAPRKGASNGPMNREATVLAHKTFHRYTTRRKQGGSQSANDNAKGTAHSAGSGLRRANEKKLVEDVRALLQDWKQLLDTSDLLFIRATGVTNRRTLFGPYDGQVLKANDPRIRGFPFTTRRATQKELMRSFVELTRFKIKEVIPVAATTAAEDAAKARSKQEKATTPKPSKPALTEEQETALLHTSQLQAMIRRSKLPALLTYLKTNKLEPDFLFQPPEQNYHAPTLLHMAAAQNAAVLVAGLISKAGADPTLRNKEGKTPFELAGDRPTRDAFRVARSELGEAKWDWEAAKVPAAITRADADKRGEREREESDKREGSGGEPKKRGCGPKRRPTPTAQDGGRGCWEQPGR